LFIILILCSECRECGVCGSDIGPDVEFSYCSECRDMYCINCVLIWHSHPNRRHHSYFTARREQFNNTSLQSQRQRGLDKSASEDGTSTSGNGFWNLGVKYLTGGLSYVKNLVSNKELSNDRDAWQMSPNEITEATEEPLQLYCVAPSTETDQEVDMKSMIITSEQIRETDSSLQDFHSSLQYIAAERKHSTEPIISDSSTDQNRRPLQRAQSSPSIFGPKWKCEHCTYLNEPSASARHVCSMCFKTSDYPFLSINDHLQLQSNKYLVTSTPRSALSKSNIQGQIMDNSVDHDENEEYVMPRQYMESEVTYRSGGSTNSETYHSRFKDIQSEVIIIYSYFECAAILSIGLTLILLSGINYVRIV